MAMTEMTATRKAARMGASKRRMRRAARRTKMRGVSPSNPEPKPAPPPGGQLLLQHARLEIERLAKQRGVITSRHACSQFLEILDAATRESIPDVVTVDLRGGIVSRVVSGKLVRERRRFALVGTRGLEGEWRSV